MKTFIIAAATTALLIGSVLLTRTSDNGKSEVQKFLQQKACNSHPNC